MKAIECTLADFFKGGKKFIVPPFQRRYAWKEKNFEMLWEDMLTVIEGDKNRHFMGTVIFDPTDKAQSLLVIDGQQRLGTFTIILKVLEELSEIYCKKELGPIRKLLKNDGNNRFVPSLPDKDAFIRLIDNPKSLKKSKAHKSVRVAYDYFKTKIINFIDNTEGRKHSNFLKILNATRQKMRFVRLHLNSHDDAHSIFETINYAGVPLTSADLARNFVLSLAKRNQSPENLNAQYWQPLENRLEENIDATNKKARKAELQRVLPELLRAFLTVKTKKYISRSDTFSKFRSFFKKGDLEKLLIELTEYSEIFCKFLNPENENIKGLRSYLEKFIDLKMTTHYPVLLLLYNAFNDKKISSMDLKTTMQYIESFVVRRAFKSKVSRDLPAVFARIAGKLAEDKSKKKKFVDGFKVLLAKEDWPIDDEFKRDFITSPIYATAPAFARYSLISIERKQSPAHRENSFDENIQIEHVFPQQPKSDDWDITDLPFLKKNLHVMGNLTLTGYNARLSNSAFKVKLKDYKQSPYWLTKKNIANKKRWTCCEIEKRSSRLLTQAMKLWPGPN